MHRMLSGVLICFLAVGLAVAAPSAADDVHLKNGRVFEDVLTRIEADQVTIELAFGSMGVPLAAVDRIEKSESSLAGYRQRRAALAADANAGAPEWIALARWSWQSGNRHGAREAAIVAADLDPRAEGLAELMSRFEFVFEPTLGRWITVEESMQLKGYRQVEGRWLSPEQQVAYAKAAAESARAREAEQESRLTKAVLAMAAAQLVREPEPREPDVTYGWPVAVYPGSFVWRHPRPYESGRGHHDPTAIPLYRRQPGSLFPVAPGSSDPPPSHHGGVSGSSHGGSTTASGGASSGRD